MPNLNHKIQGYIQILEVKKKKKTEKRAKLEK